MVCKTFDTAVIRLSNNPQATCDGKSIVWNSGQQYAFKTDIIAHSLIQNDGSPVNIQLSHGNGALKQGDGNGQSIAAFGNQIYDNRGITGDGSTHIQTYNNCPFNFATE